MGHARAEQFGQNQSILYGAVGSPRPLHPFAAIRGIASSSLALDASSATVPQAAHSNLKSGAPTVR